jgi:Flp pilus assembly pilin Flp
MKTMMFFLQKVWLDEDGAVATEYAILISGIAMAMVTAATLLGGTLQKLFEDAAAIFPK